MIQYDAAASEQRRQLRGLGVQHHHRARPQPQLQAGHQAPGGWGEVGQECQWHVYRYNMIIELQTIHPFS